jgi:hypothetical protein
MSIFGMGLAVTGQLTPGAGAVVQEIIDVLAILSALRAGFSRRSLTDFE